MADKTVKPKDDYKTFSELAEYAKQRAKISAARNGHQEFVYWLKIAQWAGNREGLSPGNEFHIYRNAVEKAAHDGNYVLAAEHYAKSVHCRKMMLNCGAGRVERLSLDWLRKAAKGIS